MPVKPVILCVDDETIIVDALKEQLNRKFGEHYTIETSESGDDALEYFNELLGNEREIPVVIADYIMPGIKGDQLLSEIHKRSPETHNILLTGQANIEGVTNAVNYADLYRYIPKPWDQDDLVITIREAIKSYYLGKQIKQKNEELVELNSSLEKKVEFRTRELQDLNATKDKFFSIIAHDLKNPFNALIGFSKHLVENYQETTDDDRMQFIAAIKEAADNGYKLLENLLDWSRAQTGKIKRNPEKIYLSAIISETCDLLNKAARNKHITIKSEVPDTDVAYADENMIKTIVRNLISNAIKYSEKGNEIKLTSLTQEGMIELSVMDEGIGIKKEDVNKLFRLDTTYSTKGTDHEGGTGLGLILCKEFVKQNGGKIWVESEYGKGSTFKLTLPVNQ